MTSRTELFVSGMRAPLVSVPYPFVERRTCRRTVTIDTREVVVPAQRRPVEGLPALRGQGRARAQRWRGWLAIGDGLALLMVQSGAVLLLVPSGAMQTPRPLAGLLATPLLLCVLIALSGGYRREQLDSGRDVWRTLVPATVGTCFVGASLVGAPLDLAGGLGTAVLAPAAVLTVLSAVLRKTWRARSRATTDVLAVGDGRLIADLVGDTRLSGGFRVVGACVPGGVCAVLDAAGVPVLGDLDAVPAVVDRFAVDVVAVTACADIPAPSLRRLSWDLEGSGVQLVVAAGLPDIDGNRLALRELGGVPVLALAEPALNDPRRMLKAALDRCCALLALVVLAPVMVAIGLAIRATSPGPALFGQTRVGRHGREFTIWKFRSMQVGAESRLGELLADNDHGDELLFKIHCDVRITPLGARLRRWSLDELPQLLNVLRGEMSLVGPRPPLPTEVGQYDDDVRRRLLVTPGMTGPWQVGGRSELSWDASIRLDLRYVEDWSLWLDLRLLCQTFSAVLRGRGAY